MTTMTATREPSNGPKSFVLPLVLADYLHRYGMKEDEVLRQLVTDTRGRTGKDAFMQVAPEQGALLTLLARISGARRAIEIGTFTGYSAICIARGLGEDGRLLTCDRNSAFTDIARRYFRLAGVDHRIDLRLGDAAEILDSFPKEDLFDFAFLDADKPNYPKHYESLLARLEVGGLLVVDNVLWGGKVADPTVDDDWTSAIRNFNERVSKDSRVEHVMIPVGDGMSIIRKLSRGQARQDAIDVSRNIRGAGTNA